MTNSSTSTFEELLSITEEDLRPIAINLRKVVQEIDPDVCEVVRLGDRAITFGVGPKKMSEGYTYILPHKSWVNLGFFRGVSLTDPTNILEGTGKNMRHVKIRSLEDSNRSDIKNLIRLALTERKNTLNIK